MTGSRKAASRCAKRGPDSEATTSVTPTDADFKRGTHARHLQELARRLDAVSSPLPGQGPYENLRPIHVRAHYCGMSVEAFLTQRFAHVPAQRWRDALAKGHIQWEGKRRALADEPVHAGTTLLHRLPGTVEPAVNPKILPLYEDEQLVVLAKPAPLPMHPCGRFCRNTLIHLLRLARPHQSWKIVHRLDADTSGVVVLAKTRDAARDLVGQFESRQVTKRYRVRVQGRLELGQRWTRRDAIAKDSSVAGTRSLDPDGRACQTRFECVELLPDDQALLDAWPSGGRTHQIRIHAAASGVPVRHDPAYGSAVRLDHGLVHATQKPLGLHALEITLRHPANGSMQTWRAPPPDWAQSSADA